MTWLQRYRVRRFLRDSVWLPPLLGMVLVLLVQPVVGRLDRVLEVKAVIGPESARAVLAALSRIDESVPQIAVWIASCSSAAYIGLFLYMIDYVGKSLRPVNVLTAVGTAGREPIQGVYPLAYAATGSMPTSVESMPKGGTSRIVKTRRTGVVLAFGVAG
jgi:uncharacterized membrane protein